MYNADHDGQFRTAYFLNKYLKFIILQITGSVRTKKKFIGCSNWKPKEKGHRFLTIPSNVDLELLENLFNNYTYHPHGIDFEVNFILLKNLLNIFIQYLHLTEITG